MQATRHMAPLLLALGLTVLTSVHAVGAEKPQIATDIPPEITTPDKVEPASGRWSCSTAYPARTPSRRSMTTSTSCVTSRCF
jgi:hypothetical protein